MKWSRLLSDVMNVASVTRDLIAERMPRSPDGVVLYDSFGNDGRVFVHGRALRDERLGSAQPGDARWRNVLAMIRRADADPIAHARVRVTAGDQSVELAADDEGFFNGWVDAPRPPRLDDEWISIDAELIDRDADTKTTGRALVLTHRPEFLVISDIDDTVLQSRVTNLLLALKTMIMENARTRLPFPGVAAFYAALRGGRDGTARNPLFYVSSSPWNLYDMIHEFLDFQRIPRGPIMLRDLDIGLNVLSSSHHHTHKREMIRRVLDTYPDLPVVLIGDSGQEDPEIYSSVVHEHRERIRAIYIRNVTRTDERATAIAKLAEEVVKGGSALLLADDTLTAAKHAAEHGLITEASLASIGSEKRADEGVTGEKKDVPGARDAGDEPTPTVVVE